MTDSYRISVVIPTYQRRDFARRLLEALAKQTMPSTDFQVILSIDGSDDGTREMAEQFLAPYALQALWHPNQGRGAACNAGICSATGKVIVLLDDDMEPVPAFLATHWQAHQSDVHLGVLGAVPIRVDSSSSPVSHYIAEKFNHHLARLAQPDHQFVLRDFYSGNFSIRRECLLGVGLFDEAFKIYGHEDLELFLRLVKRNVRVIYCADALAYQSTTKDFAALAHNHIAEGQTAVLFALKHPDEMLHTKLGTYHHFSLKWRTLRIGLINSSRTVSALPDWIIRWVTLIEQFKLRRMAMIYYFVLDYFFWLGVSRALPLHADSQLSTAILKFQKSATP